jgi:hypothetical protein
MSNKVMLPQRWLNATWVECFCSAPDTEGRMVYTADAVENPDLFLWIRQIHFPQITAKHYRNALRVLCRDQQPGYRQSPLPDALRQVLGDSIKELGKKRWACQGCKPNQKLTDEQIAAHLYKQPCEPTSDMARSLAPNVGDAPAVAGAFVTQEQATDQSIKEEMAPCTVDPCLNFVASPAFAGGAFAAFDNGATVHTGAAAHTDALKITDNVYVRDLSLVQAHPSLLGRRKYEPETADSGLGEGSVDLYAPRHNGYYHGEPVPKRMTPATEPCDSYLSRETNGLCADRTSEAAFQMTRSCASPYDDDDDEHDDDINNHELDAMEILSSCTLFDTEFETAGENIGEEYDNITTRLQDIGLVSKSNYQELEQHYTSCFSKPSEVAFSIFFTDRHQVWRPNAYTNQKSVDIVGVDLGKEFHLLFDAQRMKRLKDQVAITPPGQVAIVQGIFINTVDKFGNPGQVLCDFYIPGITLNGDEGVTMFALSGTVELLRHPTPFPY